MKMNHKQLMIIISVIILISLLTSCTMDSTEIITATEKPEPEYCLDEVILNDEFTDYSRDYDFTFHEEEFNIVSYEVPNEWTEVKRSKQSVEYMATNGDRFILECAHVQKGDVLTELHRELVFLGRSEYDNVKVKAYIPRNLDSGSFLRFNDESMAGFIAAADGTYLVEYITECFSRVDYLDYKITYTFVSNNNDRLSDELIFVGKRIFNSITYN